MDELEPMLELAEVQKLLSESSITREQFDFVTRLYEMQRDQFIHGLKMDKGSGTAFAGGRYRGRLNISLSLPMNLKVEQLTDEIERRTGRKSDPHQISYDRGKRERFAFSYPFPGGDEQGYAVRITINRVRGL